MAVALSLKAKGNLPILPTTSPALLNLLPLLMLAGGREPRRQTDTNACHIRDDGDWGKACAVDGADPVIERFASFDAYLDNADPLETIAVTPQMIDEALSLLPP